MRNVLVTSGGGIVARTKDELVREYCEAENAPAAAADGQPWPRSAETKADRPDYSVGMAQLGITVKSLIRGTNVRHPPSSIEPTTLTVPSASPSQNT